jgi:hypothetical protein
MSQTPCMNPVTISNKITQCLLSLAGKAEGSAPGSPSSSAKEVVDDILGMVTKMVLFGKRQLPVRFQVNHRKTALSSLYQSN